jgi:YVTN family beta-propeller protein
MKRPRMPLIMLAVGVMAGALLPSASASGQVGPAAGGLGSSLVGSAPTGIGPSGVAVDPVTNTIYVANGNNANGNSPGGDTVSVIDGRRCNAHAVAKCAGPWPTVKVGKEPTTLTVDQVHHTVYVTNGDDNSVSVVNGATCNGRVVTGCGQTAPSVPVGKNPYGIYVDAAQHTVYVGNFGEGTVSMFDSNACNGTHADGCPTAPPPTVTVGDGPGDVDVNRTTHTAYVSTLSGLAAFDINTCNATTQSGCAQVGTFTICAGCYGPFSAKVDEAHNTIYEADGQTTLVAIDGRACNAHNLGGCATAPHGSLTLPNPVFEHMLYIAVDEPLHSVYVVLQKDDLVLVIDTNACNGAHTSACTTLTPLGIHTGTDPEVITLDRQTQTIYVTNQLDNTVSVIDASRCNADVTAGCVHRPPRVAVADAGDVAVDEAVHTAYVTTSPNVVAMIDTRTCNAVHPGGCGQVGPTVVVGDIPQGIAVDDPTHTAYIANRGTGDTGSVSVIDTRKCNAHPVGCSTLATLQVPAGNPSGIAVNKTTNTIYVATPTSSGSNLLSVFNGATCNAGRTTGCHQSPHLMKVGPSAGPNCSYVTVAVNDVTNTVYAASTNSDQCTSDVGDQVYVYNGDICDATNTTGCGDALATVTAGLDPQGIAVDTGTNTVYVALLANGEGLGFAAVIDGKTCSGRNISGCRRTPPLAATGFGSVDAAVDQTTHQVYVTNIQDHSVSVIDGAHCNGTHHGGCGQVSDKLAVDDYPVAIAVDPAIGTAYVTSGTEGTVSVIPLL